MKIELELNDEILEKKGLTEFDVKMYFAVGLYKARIFGTSKLAELVGISRLDFIDEMGKYGCGILDMTKEELKKEFENAEKYLPV